MIQWRIFWVDLDPHVGSEQAGRRPVLVVSSDDSNDFLDTITVVPLTTHRGRSIYPNEVLLNAAQHGLAADSVALCHQVRTISKLRLRSVIGQVTGEDVKIMIQHAIRVHLGL